MALLYDTYIIKRYDHYKRRVHLAVSGETRSLCGLSMTDGLYKRTERADVEICHYCAAKRAASELLLETRIDWATIDKVSIKIEVGRRMLDDLMLLVEKNLDRKAYLNPLEQFAVDALSELHVELLSQKDHASGRRDVIENRKTKGQKKNRETETEVNA
jgi:hypothetical protein